MTRTDDAILTIMHDYAVSRETAEEMLPNLTAQKIEAAKKYRAEKPSLRAAAIEAHEAVLAKGGSNASKRAIRAARAILPDFRPHRMSPADLRRLCSAAWGEEWQTPLADAIGVNARTVRRWVDGSVQMSPANSERVRRAALAESSRLESRARAVAALAG